MAVLTLAGCPDGDAPDGAPEEVPPTPAEEEAVLSPPAEEAPGTPDGLGDRSEEGGLLLARNPAGEPGIRITVFRPNLRPRAELAGPWTRHPSPRDAGELLRVLPGVDAARRGPLGLDPVVRGLRESQVGIYLDGTRMLPASPSRMDSPLSHLDPAAVREIEVVRGPYALTWGAGNLSTIRMETRELPPDLRGELWMSLATGYDSNQRAVKTAGSFFGWSGPVSYLAHGSWRRGDDYESGSGEVVPAAFRSGEGRGKVAVDLAPGSRLTLSAGYREQGRTDYPGTFLNAESFRTVSVSGRWRLERMGDLGPSGAPGSFPLLRAVEVLAYSNHADHEGTNRDKPTALPDPDRFPPWAMDLRSTSSVAVTGARAAAELTPGSGWTAEAGADLFRAHGDGVRTLSRLDDGVLVLEDLLWPDATVVDGGLFFRLARAVGGRGNVAGALRLDLVRADADTASAFFRENVSAEPRATEANLSAAASFDVGLGSAWTLSAGLGSAVRTADATERYSDRNPSSRAHTTAEFVGDPALRPERSTQADLSLEGTYPGVVLRLDAFLRRVDDYITARPTDLPRRFPLSPAPVFRYANGEAVFRGLEASAGYAFRPPLTLRVAGSYLWGEDRTLEEPVLGISPLQGSLALRYEDLGSRFFGEGSASFAANQERVSATLGELPTRGYTTLDVRGGFRPLTGLELRLGIENLTDAEVVNHLNARDPFTGRQLREPGRSLFADLAFAF